MPHSRDERHVRPPLGPRPRARSASMAAMLPSIARGYVALTAMNFHYRPGRRRRPTGLSHSAMNLMLINISTRKLRRAMRTYNGDLPVTAGSGTSKSAASRRFVALSAERLAEWMASDLSKLDLLVIQIDGLHIGNDLALVAALGIDGDGHERLRFGLVEGSDRERRRRAGAGRQSDRARARPEGLPAVHPRRRQGAEQSHPSHLRRPHAHPALPGA